jgi:GNAT superfamily N-acetyltransferase
MALICPLPAVDRHRLLPLLEAYAAAMRGVLAGAAIAAPAAQAALLATHPAAKVLLAEEAGEPAGFAVLFDLPEIVFARRCGQLDDLFVLPAWRGRGLARAGRRPARSGARGWRLLRWFVPEEDAGAIALHQRITARADWRSDLIRLDAAASL